MSRLVSVAFTEPAVVERRKTVTRRKGWWEDKNGRRILRPGDHLTLCRKVMGRKPGEPIVKLAEVEVIDVRREPLHYVKSIGELNREGFPDLEMLHDGPWVFWARYFKPQRIAWNDDVTRIEWRYVCGSGFCECGGCVL